MEDQNTLPLQPPTVTDPGSVKKPSFLLPFFTLILGIILGAGGLLAYQKFTSKPVGEPTPLPAVTSVKEGDPTADWKIYTNEKYSYSLKYPLTFSIKEVSQDYVRIDTSIYNSSVPQPQTYLSVQKEDNPKNLSIEQLQKANPDTSRGYAIFKKNPSNIIIRISIVLMDEEENKLAETKAIFDQILSTFKFLDKEISKEEAKEMVRNLPEVKNSFLKSSKLTLEVEGFDEKENTWSVHLYGNFDDHIATIEWYYVNKYSGEITKLTEK